VIDRAYKWLTDIPTKRAAEYDQYRIIPPPPARRESSRLSQSARSKPTSDPHERSRMQYLTDGTHLYEIADMRTVQNYGLARGTFRYVMLRDCVSEMTANVNELQLAALSTVR
jgi:hypothetical protein